MVDYGLGVSEMYVAKMDRIMLSRFLYEHCIELRTQLRGDRNSVRLPPAVT